MRIPTHTPYEGSIGTTIFTSQHRESHQLTCDVGLVQTHYATWDEPLPLESGASIAPVTLAYETYGQLNSAKDNVILLLHALSSSAHAAGRYSPTDQKPGWWDSMVGPGKPFDTNRYFIICSNILGGCYGSTGPSSINPATGKPYGIQFPVITIGDIVRAQVRLIDYLHIDKLMAVVGGSMGGFQALEWAISYPERVQSAILLATTARSSPQTIAWNTIGRQAIMQDPHWCGGNYYGQQPPRNGLATARKLAHITYMSDPGLENKFGRRLQSSNTFAYTLEQEFAIESYLTYQGESFHARFDANSYLYITKAMDYWDIPGRYGSLEAALSRSRAEFLLLSFTSDWLFPPSESQAIEEALRRLDRPVTHVELPSQAGHDAFLINYEMQTPFIEDFLQRQLQPSVTRLCPIVMPETLMLRREVGRTYDTC